MSELARLEDFVQDAPWKNEHRAAEDFDPVDLIDGVQVERLVARCDNRGRLLELLTAKDGPVEPIVHVYQVFAESRSVRAWVYHKWQWDRLAYSNGRFKVVLFDLRPDSPSFGRLNEFDVGRTNPCLLAIPPLVAHGVMNIGDEQASFVNMPTRAYDPANPDKFRLPVDHPGIPYSFAGLL